MLEGDFFDDGLREQTSRQERKRVSKRQIRKRGRVSVLLSTSSCQWKSSPSLRSSSWWSSSCCWKPWSKPERKRVHQRKQARNGRTERRRVKARIAQRAAQSITYTCTHHVSDVDQVFACKECELRVHGGREDGSVGQKSQTRSSSSDTRSAHAAVLFRPRNRYACEMVCAKLQRDRMTGVGALSAAWRRLEREATARRIQRRAAPCMHSSDSNTP